ncbi:MAG: anti-sigma factor [Synechococcales cyanobacterium M58_A2018_015]|nr:anti-sigma factor [Synechococcales cyanobacterium M58_A2018_015]
MSRSARPDHWQDLIAGYALGNLSPEEAETVQRLLTEHPELRSEIEQLQEALALMPYALPDHEPPASLREAILSAAQADVAPPRLFQDAPPQPSRRLCPHRSLWLGIGSAVAALTVLALGIDNYRLRQTALADRAVIATLQQPGAQLYTLEGTENAAAASGSIVVAPDQGQLLIVAQNLPPLPSGQVYRLWATSARSAEPAYCGQFNTTADATVSQLWSAEDALCSEAPQQLLITSELATAPPVPQGDLVMKSQS